MTTTYFAQMTEMTAPVPPHLPDTPMSCILFSVPHSWCQILGSLQQVIQKPALHVYLL
jgi:hypothetical protein